VIEVKERERERERERKEKERKREIEKERKREWRDWIGRLLMCCMGLAQLLPIWDDNIRRACS